MNKEDNIEKFLRENKPVVKDDPTFLLETNRRLKSVEGIKTEVDRQRVNGRMALVVALAIGILLGATAMFIGYLYPVNPEQMKAGFLFNAIALIESWKQYLIVPVAILSLTLTFVLTSAPRKAL
jgi:hypothetical protein